MTKKKPDTISDEEFWQEIRRAALTMVTAIERRQGLPVTTELAKVGRKVQQEQELDVKRLIEQAL